MSCPRSVQSSCGWCHHFEQHTVLNALDYLLALFYNRCPVLLLVLEKLEKIVGRHFAGRLLGVDGKQIVNLRPRKEAVVEGNKLVLIQSLKNVAWTEISDFCCNSPLFVQFPFQYWQHGISPPYPPCPSLYLATEKKCNLTLKIHNWSNLDEIFCLTEGQRVTVVLVRAPELLLQEPCGWKVEQLIMFSSSIFSSNADANATYRSYSVFPLRLFIKTMQCVIAATQASLVFLSWATWGESRSVFLDLDLDFWTWT